METKHAKKDNSTDSKRDAPATAVSRLGWLRSALVFVVPLLAVLLYPSGSALLEQVNVRVKRAPVTDFNNVVSYTGAPETEIILYYFGTNATWEQLATSPFTLVYLCFAQIEKDNLSHVEWPEWCDNNNPANPNKDCVRGVKILKEYGKKVGISIGGGDGQRKVPRIFTHAYETYKEGGENHKIIEDWVAGMLAWVREHDMVALDFDNEEAHTAWTGGVADNETHVEALSSRTGLDFMGELQVEFRKQAGVDFIFSVSLQPPFYCPVKPIRDPGETNPVTFPVEPRSPWYQNYMYLFTTHPEAYHALTYLIFMYYPFENMWEWVSSIDEISRNYRIMEGGERYANLSAIYLSQVNYQMKAGTIGKLEPEKMIIATQTNEKFANKAWIPRDMLRAQLSTLRNHKRPAGLAVWSHPHAMYPESCDFLAAACEFSKQCETADQLICPPRVKPTQLAPGQKANLTEIYDWGLKPRASTTTAAAAATSTGSAKPTDETSAGEPVRAASKAIVAMLMFVLGAILLL